jgi:hypothetical protein
MQPLFFRAVPSHTAPGIPDTAVLNMPARQRPPADQPGDTSRIASGRRGPTGPTASFIFGTGTVITHTTTPYGEFDIIRITDKIIGQYSLNAMVSMTFLSIYT